MASRDITSVSLEMYIYEDCGNCGLPYWTGEYADGFGMQYIPEKCICTPRERLRASPRRPSATKKRSATKKSSKVSSRLSIAEQLAVLAELRERGALTEQEFQTLKTRLISGDKS